jgi:hypothetical protein
MQPRQSLPAAKPFFQCAYAKIDRTEGAFGGATHCREQIHKVITENEFALRAREPPNVAGVV